MIAENTAPVAPVSLTIELPDRDSINSETNLNSFSTKILGEWLDNYRQYPNTKNPNNWPDEKFHELWQKVAKSYIQRCEAEETIKPSLIQPGMDLNQLSPNEIQDWLEKYRCLEGLPEYYKLWQKTNAYVSRIGIRTAFQGY